MLFNAKDLLLICCLIRYIFLIYFFVLKNLANILYIKNILLSLCNKTNKKTIIV